MRRRNEPCNNPGFRTSGGMFLQSMAWLLLMAVWMLQIGAAPAYSVSSPKGMKNTSGDVSNPAYNYYATKGMIYNPGGGSTPTNLSTAYFVGAYYPDPLGMNGMEISIWDNTGYLITSWIDIGVPGIAVPQQAVTSVGSGVVFNDLIYVFVPVFGNTYSANGENITETKAYTTHIYTVDTSYPYPLTQMSTTLGSFEDAMTGVNYPNTPLKVAATVWNGSIWVFGTGVQTNLNGGFSGNTPMIWNSQDGQNWSCLGWRDTIESVGINPGADMIVHDAITVNADQVNGLPSGMTISDTIILLVVSPLYDVGSNTGTNMFALYFDPATKLFLKKVPLPMPTQNPWIVNAVGYFGSMYGLASSAGNCAPYENEWNSGISSVLHIIATLSAAGGTTGATLAHWYQDASGNYVLDQPCLGMDVIEWASEGCSPLPTCSVAVAPYFVGNTAACANLCSSAYLFSPGFDIMSFQGLQSTMPSSWIIDSDFWYPPINETPPGQSYQPIEAASFEGINSPANVTQQTADVNAAMRSLWQIIGVIAGPPPYDGTAFSNNPNNVSSIDFSASKTISSEQSSTFSTSYSFSNTTKMGPPFARTKISIQSGTGSSITQGSAQSFTSSIDTEIGTNTIDSTLAGQVGWVYASGPNIQPNVYNAHSAEDNSALNYSQTAMTITGTETSFFEYYLANPKNYINNGDPGVLGLMNGSMAFPLSSNFADWGNQPTWEQGGSDNAHAGTYKVLVGQFTSTNYPYPAQYQSTGLQGAAAITQSFTSDKSTVHTTDTQTQTSQGISETLEIPLIPELSNKNRAGSKSAAGIEMFKNSTEMDMSQGWESESTAGSDVNTGLTLTYATAGMLSSDQVVPYLLQATSSDAPWVPTGYTGPLPWLLTWKTSGADAQMAAESDAVTGTVSHPAFGRTPAPEMAGGSITGYAKPNVTKYSKDDLGQSLPRQDSYFIKGGKLAYMKPYGQTARIQMTAADFNPYKGIKLNINDTDIPISSNQGNWTLTGRVWKYKSTPNPKQASVELSLDFGAGTWDLDVSQAVLWWNTEPLNPVVITTLTLNDRYTLINRLGHSIAFEWESDLNSVEGQEFGVNSIHVERDYQGKGQAVLSGYMPDIIKEFGDFSVKMNRSQHDIPITRANDFLTKLLAKDTLTYSNDSAAMTADISKGTWSCTIDAAKFERPHPVAGKDGKLQLELKLGGRPVFSQRVSCDYYRMDLMYGTPQG